LLKVTYVGDKHRQNDLISICSGCSQDCGATLLFNSATSDPELLPKFSCESGRHCYQEQGRETRKSKRKNKEIEGKSDAS
jgi:hypothetical protein